MSEGFDLPLSMLVNSVAFRPNGTALLSGLWYFKSQKLPASVDERKELRADLAAHRCIRVEVVGTQRQIAEILMLAVAGESEGNAGEAIGDMRSLLDKMTSSSTTYYEFDNVNKPQGRSLPVDFPVRVDVDFPSLRSKLISDPDLIRLQLQAGWSLWNGLQSSQ